MKRPNRNLEVFSLSAIDLFASSLGAFIIIFIVLSPYYLNQAEAEKTLQQLEQELKQAKIESDNAEQKAREAEKKAQKMQANQQKIQAESDRLRKLEARRNQLNRRLAALKKIAQRRVPFALLGLASRANRFLLVIDMSSSMRNYNHLMIRTVEKMIGLMDGYNRLAILGYNTEGFEMWPDTGDMKPVNRRNKADARNFVRGLSSRFGGKTPTLEALEKALDYPAEAVILLTDGEPTDARGEWILQKITGLNKGGKEIHTVGIGDYVKDQSLVEFLKKLAQKNKGHFVGVSR